jgi:hypothetical protein
MANGFNLLALLKELLDQRWAKVLTTVLVLVLFAAWGVQRFIEPMFEDEAQVEIPKSELLQLKEIRKHMGETPLWERELTASTGEPGRTFYFDDMCQITRWTHLYNTSDGDLVEGDVIRVVFHPTRLFEREIMAAGIFKQEATECGNPEECRCPDPWEHPGESVQTETSDEFDECVVWFWNEWPDACLAYQRFNHCEGEWVDDEPQWECCSCKVHGDRKRKR